MKVSVYDIVSDRIWGEKHEKARVLYVKMKLLYFDRGNDEYRGNKYK